MPSHKVIHICKRLEPSHNPKLAKEYALLNASAYRQPAERKQQRRHNSTLAIGGVSSPLDSFVVAEISQLRIKFSAEKPAHRQSANR